MLRNVAIVLLVLAAAAPALGARMLHNELPAETLSCVSTVLKDTNGNELAASSVSVLTQKRVNSVQSSVGSQGEAACLRMKVTCSDGNNAQFCTAADNAAAVTKTAYMLTTTNVCSYYKSYAQDTKGFVQDVYCCSTNNCNQ